MIKLLNVSKQYTINSTNTITAIDNISLDFNEGELVILKGSSGSGKSTILSLIAALTKPTIGEVIVNTQRVSKLTDNFASLYRRNTVGIIFQKYNLIPNLSVLDNIVLPLVPENLDQTLLEKKAFETMSKFDIIHKKNIIVKNLSGGEQQRVAIARAHINDPQIILADEPTANLDKNLSENFIKILKELKSTNKTIIIATHDPLFFTLDFVDKIITIENGKIAQCS